MDVKKQELDLNKQEQEQMVESENQQRDMLKQNDKLNNMNNRTKYMTYNPY